jgi:hypothetical protein
MMINDPAWGPSKAKRALGEHLTEKKNTKRDKTLKAKRSRDNNLKGQDRKSRLEEFRVIQHGVYDGPKASYGRYNVSEQSADILNRQKRNMDMR